MDLSIMSVQELKALAYDLIADLEQAQTNLKAVNQAIAKKSQEKPEETPIEPEVVETPNT